MRKSDVLFGYEQRQDASGREDLLLVAVPLQLLREHSELDSLVEELLSVFASQHRAEFLEVQVARVVFVHVGEHFHDVLDPHAHSQHLHAFCEFKDVESAVPVVVKHIVRIWVLDKLLSHLPDHCCDERVHLPFPFFLLVELRHVYFVSI